MKQLLFSLTLATLCNAIVAAEEETHITVQTLDDTPELRPLPPRAVLGNPTRVNTEEQNRPSDHSAATELSSAPETTTLTPLQGIRIISTSGTTSGISLQASEPNNTGFQEKLDQFAASNEAFLKKLSTLIQQQDAVANSGDNSWTTRVWQKVTLSSPSRSYIQSLKAVQTAVTTQLENLAQSSTPLTPTDYDYVVLTKHVLMIQERDLYALIESLSNNATAANQKSLADLRAKAALLFQNSVTNITEMLPSLWRKTLQGYYNLNAFTPDITFPEHSSFFMFPQELETTLAIKTNAPTTTEEKVVAALALYDAPTIASTDATNAEKQAQALVRGLIATAKKMTPEALQEAANTLDEIPVANVDTYTALQQEVLKQALEYKQVIVKILTGEADHETEEEFPSKLFTDPNVITIVDNLIDAQEHTDQDALKKAQTAYRNYIQTKLSDTQKKAVMNSHFYKKTFTV